MHLDLFDSRAFDRGASRWKELLWLICGGVLVSSWLPGSAWRVSILRVFGAQIGKGAVIKPSVRIKFPWRLVVGEHSWIGESVWIDNLAEVRVGDNVCISQGAYICTGSHDWTVATFDLIVKKVYIGSHSWLGAMSRVAPGITVGEGAVLSFGGVATHPLVPWEIHVGNPAVPLKKRPRSVLLS